MAPASGVPIKDSRGFILLFSFLPSSVGKWWSHLRRSASSCLVVLRAERAPTSSALAEPLNALQKMTRKLALRPFARFGRLVDVGALAFIAAQKPLFGHDLHEFQKGGVLRVASTANHLVNVAHRSAPHAPENCENFQFGVAGTRQFRHSLCHKYEGLLVRALYLKRKMCARRNAVVSGSEQHQAAANALGDGFGARRGTQLAKNGSDVKFHGVVGNV
jgi:hypothetical protein